MGERGFYTREGIIRRGFIKIRGRRRVFKLEGGFSTYGIKKDGGLIENQQKEGEGWYVN